MFRKLKRYIRDPYHEIGYDVLWKHPDWMSDKWYLKSLWKRTFGYELDLKHPKTFNEKLQWLKLYDRKPEYTLMVDKCRAKQWVADKIGEQYIIPTLAVYNSVDEIDLDRLPNKFVLKCNHDSGNVVICKDKSTFDLQNAKAKLAAALKNDYYLKWREWPYKNVKRCVFAEKYLEDSLVKTPTEFKFFCFNGEPVLFQSIYDRNDERGPILQHFSLALDRLEIKDKHYKSRQDGREENIVPHSLEKLISFSRQLSLNTFFLRVDFYEEQNNVYVGELTFFESAGFVEYTPDKYNRLLGDWIKLPID